MHGHPADVDRVDRAAPDVRLTVMCLELPAAGDVLRRLKFSNAEIGVVVALLRVAVAPPPDPILTRRALAKLDRATRPLAVQLWASQPADTTVAQRILDEKHPLAAGDLAITGKDLMTALDMKPGPAVGSILEHLVDFVVGDPARNTRDTLIARARAFELEVGH